MSSEIVNVVSLDLELAQPSERIIEVGVTVGNLYERTILASKSFFVNPHEELSPFIKDLCHIEQATVDAAPDLIDAYNDMAEFLKPFNVHRMMITWGAGDGWQLRSQLNRCGKPYEWAFGRTEMNVKNLIQAQLMAQGQRIQGGLAKSMTKFGLTFKGTKHVAKDDSLNTLLLFYRYLDLTKEIQIKR